MNEARPRGRPASAEHARLAEGSVDHPGDWKAIGPYVSERAWGTVREDYSPDGKAWEYFTHEHARSRAYRWNEDGLAGICDLNQYLCFAMAFWNGRDPFLKERLFGLSGPEGNHGEDVKEYWWYADATPTASWLSWRYHYPQSEFPYQRLREENARRGRQDPEFELIDTGAFDDDRYWQIVVDYAKAAPRDLCVRIEIRNAGPEAAELHVLPTLWFRNRWSWGDEFQRPSIKVASAGPGEPAMAIAEDADLGRWRLAAGPDPTGRLPELLFCENETNVARLFGVAARSPFPKDGVNDHVVAGAATVNPARIGTKMACWHRLTVAPGERVELRLRLARDDATGASDLGADFDLTFAKRRQEADEYYATLRPPGATDEEAAVMRQAFAGLVWSEQFYHFDVLRWQEGDPTEPPPPAARRGIRNAQWRHLDSHDLLVMPDKWEYPWFAAWDLAFQCVALAHIDPAAAKHQLRLLSREWYMHPNGQLPAYEWNFSDVNPPVQAWAALAVFNIDGGEDFDFLARAFHKLLITFTWWVNREDAIGDNIFEGGFLGLDNIGPFDRSAALPGGGILEQSDGTAWMAKLCLNMLEMAVRLANHDPSYEDVALKFFEHFAKIASRWANSGTKKTVSSMIVCASRTARSSRSALVRWWACFRSLPPSRSARRCGSDCQTSARGRSGSWNTGRNSRSFCISRRTIVRNSSVSWANSDCGEYSRGCSTRRNSSRRTACARSRSFTATIRSFSTWTAAAACASTTNRRVPDSAFRRQFELARADLVPLNFLAVESLRNLHGSLGDQFTVEMPTGRVRRRTRRRGRRDRTPFVAVPAGQRWASSRKSGNRLFDQDPAWNDRVFFYEYFHGETGQGSVLLTKPAGRR